MGITASLNASDLLFSQGASAPLTVSGVTASGGIVTGIVGDLPEKVDAVMVIAVVFDTSLGIYTHTVFDVLSTDDLAISLDTNDASSGNVVHLYAVPMSLTDEGLSYFRSADGAQRNENDGYALTMMLRTKDGSYRCGRSQYLASVTLDNAGNGQQSGNNSQEPAVTTNVTITANANDASMGSVSGGGTYVQGASVTLTATANEGYHFVSWSNGRTTASITVTADADATYTATFAADGQGGSGDNSGMDG